MGGVPLNLVEGASQARAAAMRSLLPVCPARRMNPALLAGPAGAGAQAPRRQAPLQQAPPVEGLRVLRRAPKPARDMSRQLRAAAVSSVVLLRTSAGAGSVTAAQPAQRARRPASRLRFGQALAETRQRTPSVSIFSIHTQSAACDMHGVRQPPRLRKAVSSTKLRAVGLVDRERRVRRKKVERKEWSSTTRTTSLAT
jgi:hypothetical protein